MPVIKKGPPIARHVLYMYVLPQYREAITAFFGPLGNQSACTILLRNLGPVQKAISLNLDLWEIMKQNSEHPLKNVGILFSLTYSSMN